MRAALDTSTHDLIAGFLRSIAEDRDILDIPMATLDLARTIALRRHDVGLLLRAYRIGQRLAWSELLPVLTEEISDPELRFAALTALFDRLTSELERVIDESVNVFTQERDRWLSGSLARKTNLVHAILRGEPVDADEATRVLEHRMHRYQLALLLRLEEESAEPDALSTLEAAVQEIGRLLGTRDALTLPDGTRSLQGWFGVGRNPDLTGLDSVVQSWPGMRAAVGLAEYGIPGFRTSHRQAVIASRVARSARDARPVSRYRDVALVGAFLDDVESMRDLVARELGGLVAKDASTARLRETLLAYLRAGGSARDAAAAIGVHKNTVLYRLPRIEEQLGHAVDERQLTLEMALEIVSQLGDFVLPDS
jgi:DNA-binding PucR family transcriptional regulator